MTAKTRQLHRPGTVGLVAILLLLLWAVSCTSKEPPTWVTVVFDVEDYTTPASEGLDDIPLWLAETMTEVGVKGTFFVIGEKARSLEQRGRTDVIAAMARHDIGSHTNRGSIHPTVTEQLELADWDDGVALMREQEAEGIADLERIFGVPVTALARHGGSYGPQLVTALGEMGRGYVYSPVSLPGHNAVWFCNTLNFHGEYGGFDNTYFRNDSFEPVFEELKQSFDGDIESVDVLNFFACHPCKVRTIQFWDFNYYYGANPDSADWRTPDMRPLESMETARENFRRLMVYLKEREDIRIVGYQELMERFSSQPTAVRRRVLEDAAERVIAEQKAVIHAGFSPAEIFAALAQSIQEHARTSRLPGSVDRISPLGPMLMPMEDPETDQVLRDQALVLAGEADEFISTEGYLPPWLTVDGARIGTGSLLVLFSELFLDLTAGDAQESHRLTAFEAWPKEHDEEIVRRVESYKDWPVHRTDLDMSRIVEFTRLQLWTLKPALER
jgi:peptidoglycan/xylan/chitin deacetylase (PgdA/CDA1 family)